jgi:hypothetical protein
MKSTKNTKTLSVIGHINKFNSDPHSFHIPK